MRLLNENNLFNLLRFSLAFIMLWNFFDKAFGLGFSTSPSKAWIQGVSPTAGFLKFATEGVFAPLFNSLSGNIVIDILFMAGSFLIGACLVLGIGLRVASYSGVLFMALIYLSLFPPDANPFIDQHVVYSLVFLLLLERSKKQDFGLSKKWRKLDIVKKFPILE